jgi:S-adenosylmethionine:tRNA ribosyltransferase-isomerase
LSTEEPRPAQVDETSADSLSAYTFALPEDRIAQRPLAERSAARLLVLRRDAMAPEHRTVRDLVELLEPGDVLVVNDTAVIPARLYGEKAGTGGRVEVLLVRKVAGSCWACLVNASKKPKDGTRLVFAAGGAAAHDAFFATVEGALEEEPGVFLVRFDGDPVRFATHYGHVPLPPYIERDDDEEDLDRYQTVFHDEEKPGSSAAPTAGLHFDEPLLAALQEKGVMLARVTLHVGPGTFLPVRGDHLSEHVMHPEPWAVGEEAAQTIRAAREQGRRVIAVGTTSLRCLESAAAEDGTLRAGSGLTRLFVKPGYRFKIVDCLVTNFHLPGSTLFVLVSAFAGRARMKSAYEEAIREGYRFYSYGDASFLERAGS